MTRLEEIEERPRHYGNAVKGRRGFVKIDVADRFFGNIEQTGTCWLWQGSLSDKGYGTIWHKNRSMAVHRFSWEYHNGREIPAGFFVCHKCDVPNCVNPAHLFLGTPKDNQWDSILKGRAKLPPPTSNNILTEEQVIEIRKALSYGISQQKIANRYGVSRPCIQRIKAGTTWKHLALTPEECLERRAWANTPPRIRQCLAALHGRHREQRMAGGNKVKEPVIHSHITDDLQDDHPLAWTVVDCVECGVMLHCSNNECMQTWVETGLGSFCLNCFAKRNTSGFLAEDYGLEEKEEYRPMATNSYQEIRGVPDRMFMNEMAGRTELNE